jgi:hypothetical protein
VRGGATPPQTESRDPTYCLRWPLRWRRSPSPSQRKKYEADNVQFRRCPPPLTPRCPHRFAVSPKRRALPRVRAGSAFGSNHEGGATPPRTKTGPKRRSFGPLGGVAPPSPVSGSSEPTVAQIVITRREQLAVIGGQRVIRLAPKREHMVVLDHVKVSRATRAAPRP